MLVATTQIQTQADTIANTPVYRLYNKTTKEHLYTINSTEYNTLANSKSHWIKEGIAFNAPTLSKIPSIDFIIAYQGSIFIQQMQQKLQNS
nr:hypothetical protein [Lactococcus fujiensis]